MFRGRFVTQRRDYVGRWRWLLGVAGKEGRQPFWRLFVLAHANF